MHRLLGIAIAFSMLASGQSFEVASISPSSFQSADGEGSRRETIGTSREGLTMRNVTLRSCVSWAYSVQDFQIAGLTATDRYDIAAKATGPATTIEFRAMLANLLTERFKLVFHRESKTLPAYTLAVAKGGAKLGESKLRESKEEGPGILRPVGASLSAQHASMWEFAGALAGPLRTPVIDGTGLTGRYDFTVDLMPYLPESKSRDVDMASIVMPALRDQLGLALESHKEPIEILVVDRAQKIPSAN